MSIHFSKLFWGLLLLMIDISFNRLDLLPDGFGSLLIASGCGGLAALSKKFVVAGVLCFVLFGFWMLGFAMNFPNAAFAQVARSCFECMTIWFLLGGIIDFAIAKNRFDFVSHSNILRVGFIAISVGALFMARGTKGAFHLSPLFAILFLGSLVLTVSLLRLIFRVRAELADCS